MQPGSPADGVLSWEETLELIDEAKVAPRPHRQQIAASISKTAAKAGDEILIKLASEAELFLRWLISEDTLTRAYSACILANIAFLQQGQQQILALGGVSQLVRLITRREDRKVVLHCVAALQNLTYKNSECCFELLDQGGEKALKKLLKKSPDEAMHQYAAGAVANLMLYRRNPAEWNLNHHEPPAPSPSHIPELPPPPFAAAAESTPSKTRRTRRIMGARRSSNPTGGFKQLGVVRREERGGDDEQRAEAARLIQQRFRGMAAARGRAPQAEAPRRDQRFGQGGHGIGNLVNCARAEAGKGAPSDDMAGFPTGAAASPWRGGGIAAREGLMPPPSSCGFGGCHAHSYSMPPSFLHALAAGASPGPSPPRRPTRLQPIGAQTSIERLPALNDASLPPLVMPIHAGPAQGRGFQNVMRR